MAGNKDELMEKIGSEGILIEILVLLPPKSIFRFISVSKRWRDIIKHPHFLERYSAAAPRRCGGGHLLAFFQVVPREHCNTLPVRIPGRRNTIKYVPESFGEFINSSNGLILCGRPEARRYHVVNPVTRTYVSLPPPPPDQHDLKSTGLIYCEENTTELAPIYTVVEAHSRPDSRTMTIDTYHSTTGEWSGQKLLVATGCFSCYLPQPPPVLVANGVIHWHISSSTVAVYDPNDRENHLQLIRLPRLFEPADCYMDWTFSHAITRSADDDGVLWFGLTSHKRRMQFFMLPKGEDGCCCYKRKATINGDEWVLMHDIRLDSIGEDEGSLSWKQKIALESFLPAWNSRIVAVLRQGARAYLYNLERGSFERVYYRGVYHTHGVCDSHLIPYVEPSFLSSYAL